MDTVLYLDSSLGPILTYGSSGIWENDHFVVSDGNHGKYLIIRCKGHLDGIKIIGSSKDLSHFKNLPGEDARAKYLWSELVRVYEPQRLSELCDRIYKSGILAGRNSIRQEFGRLIAFE